MNPFSLPINDSLLYTYREQQRIQKLENYREARTIPIYDRSPEVKIPVLSEFRRNSLPPLSDSASFKTSFISNRESLDGYINRKREILFVKKSIENKKKNIEMLESSIKEQDKKHKETLKNLEEQYNRVEKYEERLMIEAKMKSENTEIKTHERISLQNSLSKLSEDIEKTQARLERKIEELKHYEVLKKFVETIAIQTIPQEEESTIFVTQEHAIFNDPTQVLESINILESNNLFQIRQLQEAEQELETLKSKNKIDQGIVAEKKESLMQSIIILEKQKDALSFKLKNYDFEKKEENTIDEKTLEEIHSRLTEMSQIIGIESYKNLSDLEILERIEYALKEKSDQRDSMNEEFVKRLEKEIDKARRASKIEKIKNDEVKKRMEISELLQKRKKNIIKKLGRQLMPRSHIAEKKIIQEVLNVSQDELDRIEFLDEILKKK